MHRLRTSSSRPKRASCATSTSTTPSRAGASRRSASGSTSKAWPRARLTSPPLEPCRVAAGQTLGIAASHRPDQAAWSPRRSDARARGCRWRPERRVGAARGPLGLTRGGSLEDGRRTGGPGIVRRPRRRYRGRAPTRVLHTPSLSTDRLTGRPCGLPSTRPVENPRAGDGCYENGRDRAKAAPFDADQPGDSRLPPALFHAERTSARRTARGQQQGPQTRARRNHNEHEAGCFQAPRPLAAPLSDSRVPRTSSGGCGVASSCCPLPIPCGRCTGVFPAARRRGPCTAARRTA